MGTSLTGTKPKDTYDSLIKVTDNGPLNGTMKTLTDGLGNDSVLALSTTAAGIGTTVLTDISSSGAGNEGAYIKNDGQIGLATSNDAVGIFNRKTSTGTLFDFRYNGASVGSIGVTSTGASINLGGTAAANELDDYEEGTFTATLTPSTSGSITGSATYHTWTYTKVGRQVTINGVFVVSSVASPVGAEVSVNLPFTVLAVNGAYGSASVSYLDHSTSTWSLVPNKHGILTTFLDFVIDASTVAANDEFYVTATYFV